MDRVRFLDIPDATPIDSLIVQHQAILDAIAAGRGAAAEQAMRDHLREILKSLPRLSRAFRTCSRIGAAPRPPKPRPQEGRAMKITSAKVIVTCPGRNFVTLKIVTDEGVHGLGDATLNGRELAVVALPRRSRHPAA